MTIVESNSFRSNGLGVHRNDDMVRVVVDMTKREFWEFRAKLHTTSGYAAALELPKYCAECPIYSVCSRALIHGNAPQNSVCRNVFQRLNAEKVK